MVLLFSPLNRYMDGFVKQQKHNMLNNISGYGWINKQFAHPIAMDINEVNAYRMDKTQEIIRLSNARSLGNPIDKTTALKGCESDDDEDYTETRTTANFTRKKIADYKFEEHDFCRPLRSVQ